MDVRAALLTPERAFELSLDGRNLLLPATPLTALGDPAFLADHGVRFPYMAGAMANGIASVPLVAALGRSGFLGIYGAAGQAPDVVAQAADRLNSELGRQSFGALPVATPPFGMNLIHSPGEADLEARIADLYIQKGIRLVEASAYLALTLPVVRYRVHGIHRTADGRVVTPNRVIAKVSRVEVASQFFAPPPPKFLAVLVQQGLITAEQAELAALVPMATDVTAEADSGGHTDNRPLVALLPTLLALRDRMMETHGYAAHGIRLRVGAAGGIATPAAVAAAFAMGAAYVVTGSVNQAAAESGTSDLVRAMLAKAGPADIAMAPAADMFEMGVKVQVLKQGTMFPMRATKLYELYQKHRSLDELPPKDREMVETQLFRTTVGEAWEATKRYFAVRDPRQITKGETDPRHKMALVFRSYLGQSSHWANQGVEGRRFDFQVWCGPSMGAFNEWAQSSPLAEPAGRRVVPIALNLLFGAAVQLRATILRLQGAPAALVPGEWRPLAEPELRALLEQGGA